jgi:hypothetical protein
MSAEEQIKEQVGTLYANTAPQPVGGVGIPMSGFGEGDSAAQMEAIRADIRQLYHALLLIGRQIDHLSSKLDRI